MLNAPPGIDALLFGLFILSAVFLRLRVIAGRTELSGLLAGTGVVMIDETPPHDAAHTGSPHPAITHFIRRFNELINQWSVLPAGNGRRPRNLTAKKVHDLLGEQAPSVAPSSHSSTASTGATPHPASWTSSSSRGCSVCPRSRSCPRSHQPPRSTRGSSGLGIIATDHARPMGRECGYRSALREGRYTYGCGRFRSVSCRVASGGSSPVGPYGRRQAHVSRRR